MEELILLQYINNLPKERLYKLPRNTDELDNEEFRKLYRLPRCLFRELCDAVRPDLEKRHLQKCTVMSIEQQVKTVLRFYGTGGYQQCIATDASATCSQGQVSKCVTAVTNAIVNRLAHKISFPETVAQKNANKLDFYNYHNHHFPGIIGR